jgi:type II secretory pathway pseudopilin PulG
MRRSFTLVELLITIGVITVLVAISVPALSAVRRRSEVKETKALMARLSLALEHYADEFGDYPPSRLKKLGARGNGKNEGSECLVRCLTTQEKGGPFIELQDAELGNSDEDQLPSGQDPTRSTQKTRDLLEVHDRWGNPIAYTHNRDYDQGASVQLQTGVSPVQAAKSDVTGSYQALTKFQLWSAGPDGQAGTEDDVTSWEQ